MTDMTDTLDDLNRREYQNAKSLAAAQFLSCIATTRSAFEAADEFSRRYPRSVLRKHIEQLVETKALVVPGVPAPDGSPSSWGPDLVPGPELSASLLQFSQPFSIVERLGLAKAPFNVAVPRDLSTFGETDFFRGPGVSKVVVQGSFDSASLTLLTVAAIAVFSTELAKSTAGTAASLMRTIVARALGNGLDRAFFSDDAGVANVSPAGILAGLTPIGSTGDPSTDLKLLISEFVTAGGSLEHAVLVMSSTNAIGARITAPELFRDLQRDGGRAAGLPTVAGAAAGENVALIDTTKVLLADDGQFKADVSTQATLNMGGSPPEFVSLYQQNASALKLERAVNWRAVEGAAAYVSAANYLTTSSPA